MRKYRDSVLVACVLYFALIFPADLHAGEPLKGCEVQGIDAEMDFAKKVCGAAENIGLHPTLVHSYGAGGVDIFISESEANDLRRGPEKLKGIVTSLAEWAKQTYSGFNAVDVTIVGGNSKIAQGSKLGQQKTKVTLY
jgi:hypothetical protein